MCFIKFKEIVNQKCVPQRKTVRSDTRLFYNTIPWYCKTYTLHLLLINQNLIYSTLNMY